MDGVKETWLVYRVGMDGGRNLGLYAGWVLMVEGILACVQGGYG